MYSRGIGWMLLFVCLTATVTAGCDGGNATNMAEKIALENGQADIFMAGLGEAPHAARDCEAMATAWGEWREQNQDARHRLDAWWGDLSSEERGSLVADNRAAWNRQTDAFALAVGFCGEVLIPVEQAIE